MRSLSEAVRTARYVQHTRHATDAVGCPLPEQTLHAIIVPASRPAANLDHAVTLARAVGCQLLILCSRRARSAEVRQLLAERSFDQAVVVDLPDGYHHELLDFSALMSVKDDLPVACATYITDLSMKRNLGLLLARMLGWRRIFFLDDDIRDISYSDLQNTVSKLESFPSVGMRVTDFPDNSAVCHAQRMTGGFQEVFVTGAALAVDCYADIGFFPDIYNEDWLFFYDDTSHGRLACSGRSVTQLRYDPFADAQHAAWQEFGDILAEGLYELLHQGMGVQHATREYWSLFLEARRYFIETIICRSDVNMYEQARLLGTVEQALRCEITIAPELLERYILLWRRDLHDWKQRIAGIPRMPSVNAALRKLELSPSVECIAPRLIQHCRDVVPGNIPSGPVLIPRFDTLKGLSECAAISSSVSCLQAEPERQSPRLKLAAWWSGLGR